MGAKGVCGGGGGVSTPSPKGLGTGAPEKKKMVHFLWFFVLVFWHMNFADNFLIAVKELGLLSNLGQWIRIFDATGYHVYILL
jgi:hypothetical protein